MIQKSLQKKYSSRGPLSVNQDLLDGQPLTTSMSLIKGDRSNFFPQTSKSQSRFSLNQNQYAATQQLPTPSSQSYASVPPLALRPGKDGSSLVNRRQQPNLDLMVRYPPKTTTNVDATGRPINIVIDGN